MGACSGSSSSSFGHRGNPPSPSRLVVCSSAPAQLVNSGSVSSTPQGLLGDDRRTCASNFKRHFDRVDGMMSLAASVGLSPT
ncbi:hypothetical protein GN956_G19928 [Arapaima gigas]